MVLYHKILNNAIIFFSMIRPNQEHYGMIKKNIDNFLVSTGFTTINVDKNQTKSLNLSIII